MSVRKILFLFVFALMAGWSVTAQAAHRNIHKFPLSKETRRIVAECRRQPTDALRKSLRQHVARDFDRHVAEQRRKFKSGKRHRINRKQFEAMVHARDQNIDAMVTRLLEHGSDGLDKTPESVGD